MAEKNKQQRKVHRQNYPNLQAVKLLPMIEDEAWYFPPSYMRQELSDYQTTLS